MDEVINQSLNTFNDSGKVEQFHVGADGKPYIKYKVGADTVDLKLGGEGQFVLCASQGSGSLYQYNKKHFIFTEKSGANHTFKVLQDMQCLILGDYTHAAINGVTIKSNIPWQSVQYGSTPSAIVNLVKDDNVTITIKTWMAVNFLIADYVIDDIVRNW